MNHRNALIFPETAPNGGTLRQLLLFFDTIFHYLPVEADPETGPPPTNLPTGLCTSYAPVPLGEERELFQKIIRSLEKQKEDGGGLISGLSLAHLSSSMAGDRDEALSSTLSAALKKSGDTKTAALELMQARVLLKLAESMDREEEEIAAKLAEIAGSEQELLDALKGPLDEEEEWQETGRLNPTPDPTPAGDHAILPPGAVITRRTRAFSRLYRADISDIRPRTLVTASSNAAEPLLNGYEKLTQKPSLPLFILPMPSAGEIASKAGTGPAFDAYRQEFRKMVHQPLAVLTGPDRDPEKISAAETAWQEAVFSLFSPSVQWQLAWYDLGPVSLETLFATAFPGDSAAPVNRENDFGALAVLSRN